MYHPFSAPLTIPPRQAEEISSWRVLKERLGSCVGLRYLVDLYPTMPALVLRHWTRCTGLISFAKLVLLASAMQEATNAYG